jgi:hypothetical protein
MSVAYVKGLSARIVATIATTPKRNLIGFDVGFRHIFTLFISVFAKK